MTPPQIVALTESDIDRIIALERKSFIPALQVDVGKLHRRFALKHLMLGVEDCEDLIGMISFSYAHFDPADRGTFPDTEQEFCMCPQAADYNTVYLYNFEVIPDRRGGAHARRLFLSALRYARNDGCRLVVACPRIPSYAGSHAHPQEHIDQRPLLKVAIDRHLQGGTYPTLDELLVDPLLAFYYRLGQAVDCKFHWVIPNFAPHDHAAGGIRVLMYGELDRWSEL